MCIIVVKNKGIKIDKEQANYWYESNPHGAGYVKNNGKTNLIMKGFFSFSDFWESYKRTVNEETDKVILHFRIASAGAITQTNTQPFIISHNDRTLNAQQIITKNPVLCHNGTINHFCISNQESDTRLFVKNIVCQDDIKEKIFYSQALQNITALAVDPSRLALINAAGKIVLIGKWHSNDNLLFSNHDYKKTVFYQAGFQAGTYVGNRNQGNKNKNKNKKDKKKNNNYSVQSDEHLFTETEQEIIDYYNGDVNGLDDYYKRYNAAGKRRY